MGTECHYFICDVGNREEVYQTAKAVREKASSLAGLSSGGPALRWQNGCFQSLWGLSREPGPSVYAHV